MVEHEPTGWMDRISLVISRICMAVIAFVVAVMFYEVVMRYVFEAPTLWANEMSLWMAAFVFLLSGLYAMQQRSHIRIYILYDMMPRTAQRALRRGLDGADRRLRRRDHLWRLQRGP